MTSKVNVGGFAGKETLEKIDAIIEASRYFEPTRSEVVEAILAAFFKSPPKLHGKSKGTYHQAKKRAALEPMVHQVYWKHDTPSEASKSQF
ncbi:MAG: hypothetical protein ACTSV7_00230 [Candidatus Baldrarchaeia archaeon]